MLARIAQIEGALAAPRSPASVAASTGAPAASASLTSTATSPSFANTLVSALAPQESATAAILGGGTAATPSPPPIPLTLSGLAA